MYKYILFILSVFVVSCNQGNHMKAKYETRYLDIQQKINANRGQIEGMLNQLPQNYQVEMRKSMTMVQNNDINGFLKESRMSEKNFDLFLKSVDTFMGRLDTARGFTPNAAQISLYNDLKGKVEKNRESVEKFISKPANPNDINEVTSKNFLGKILKYDVHEFLANSVITEPEFNAQIKEFNDSWDEVALALIMADFNSELDALMKK